MLADRSNELVGSAIAVITRDGQVETATMGRPDVDNADGVTSTTQFMLGSTSKLLTATLVMQQVQEHKINLDTAITAHLPEASTIWDSKSDVPTVRHILSHSAGLMDIFEPIQSIDDMVAKIVQSGQLATPGAILSYSNIGYVMLGYLLERVTGVSWKRLVQTRVLDNLNVTGVKFDDDGECAAEDHMFAPDGSVKKQRMWPRISGIFGAAGTTASADIASATALLRAFLFDSSLLDTSSRQAMQTMQIGLPGPSVFCEGWGLGWGVVDNSVGLVGHMGGSHAYMVGSARLGKAAVFLSNTENGAIVGKTICMRALGLDGKTPVPAGLSPFPDVRSFLGRYRGPMITCDVSSEEKASLSANVHINVPGDKGTMVNLSYLSGRTFIGGLASLTTEFTFITDGGVAEAAKYVHCGLRALPRVLEMNKS